MLIELFKLCSDKLFTVWIKKNINYCFAAGGEGTVLHHPASAQDCWPWILFPFLADTIAPPIGLLPRVGIGRLASIDFLKLNENDYVLSNVGGLMWGLALGEMMVCRWFPSLIFIQPAFSSFSHWLKLQKLHIGSHMSSKRVAAILNCWLLCVSVAAPWLKR